MTHMHSAAAALQQLTTDTTPTADRAEFFQQAMQRLFSVGLSVKSAPAMPLQARMNAYCGRRLRFAEVRFSPHSTVSSGATRHPDSRLLVSLHREGAAVVSQGGREHRIEPGDIFIVDPTRAFTIETGEIRTQSLYLHPGVIRQLVPGLDQLTAVPMPSDRGPGAIYRAAVEQMFEIASSLNDEVADRLSDALPYLLAPSLSAIEDQGNPQPSRLKQLHRQRILRFVRDNLSDVDLDANMIAAGVQLSPRHVYELFADEPEPLMKWVWGERLERCRKDLESAVLANRSIGEIAYSWGFRDVSHFCRTFKRTYGKTPREWRRGSQQETVAEALPA